MIWQTFNSPWKRILWHKCFVKLYYTGKQNDRDRWTMMVKRMRQRVSAVTKSSDHHKANNQ